jgi:hypothetical protein
MKFQEKKSNGNAHFSEVKHALLLQNDIGYKQWFKNKVKYK